MTLTGVLPCVHLPLCSTLRTSVVRHRLWNVGLLMCMPSSSNTNASVEVSNFVMNQFCLLLSALLFTCDLYFRKTILPDPNFGRLALRKILIKERVFTWSCMLKNFRFFSVAIFSGLTATLELSSVAICPAVNR